MMETAKHVQISCDGNDSKNSIFVYFRILFSFLLPNIDQNCKLNQFIGDFPKSAPFFKKYTQFFSFYLLHADINLTHKSKFQTF